MSRATNRTSNISVTWNFKNPNISRNELINFIHLFREVPGYSREVPGYSRGLSRHCLAIPAVSRYLYCLAVSQLPRCLHQASFLHFHLSSLISHRTPARKSPERLFSPIQRPPESFPTTPPEISRFPFGTKVIKILDLSPYLPPTSYPPPTRPFAVSPTLPYSPKPVLPISKASLSYSPEPVLHQPRHQTESTPLVHQSPCTFILISPCLTTTLISPVHHFLQLPSSLSRQAHPHCYPSYSPKPVLHQPRHQTESVPLVHQSPCTFYPHLTLSYNNTHQSSSSLPTITKFAFPTGPSALLSFLFPKTSPSPTTPPARIRSSRSSISLHVYPHLTLSYDNTHQSRSSFPTINKFAFPTVHPALFSFSLAI